MPSHRKVAMTFMRDMVDKARGSPAVVAHVEDINSCLHQTREEKLSLTLKMFVALDFSAQVTLVDDIQKMENDLSINWTIGQVDSVTRSKDGCVRRVSVRYHNHGEAVARYTERSVRSLVRLFHVEDDYFVKDMKLVEDMMKELEKESDVNDQRVEPMRLHRDHDGSYRIIDNANVSNVRNCDCCCDAHCKMTYHSASGRVSGVTLTALAVMTTTTKDLAMMYDKELVEYDDTKIVPECASEVEDDLFAMITALETDFTITCEETCSGHSSDQY